jgi:lipopolysaccharide transport system permease protein
MRLRGYTLILKMTIKNSKNKEILITSRSPSLLAYFYESIKCYDLLIVLLLKEIKIRYSSWRLALCWVVSRPLLMAIVLLLVNGAFYSDELVSKWDSFKSMLIGYSIWQAFQTHVNESVSLLRNSSYLISKIYFPRILLHVVSALFCLFESLPYILLIFAFNCKSLQQFVSLFFLLLALLLFNVICGLVVGAASLIVKEIRHAIPFVLQLLFLTTPIINIKSLNVDFSSIFLVNPINLFIELSFCILLNGHASVSLGVIVIAILSLIFFLITSCKIFILVTHRFIEKV